MRYMVDGKDATAAEYAAAPAGKCKGISSVDSDEEIAAKALEAEQIKCKVCGK